MAVGDTNVISTFTDYRKYTFTIVGKRTYGKSVEQRVLDKLWCAGTRAY